jgi:hypothetical protein
MGWTKNQQVAEEFPERRGDAEKDAERMRDIEGALFPGFERGGSGDTLCQPGICVMIHDSREAHRLRRAAF